MSSVEPVRSPDDPASSASTLQRKYNKQSKIPVKSRQFSVPVQHFDDSVFKPAKKSQIPRITSSPGVSPHLTRTSLSPIVNSSSNYSTPKAQKAHGSAKTPPSTVTKLSARLASLSLDSPSKMTNNGDKDDNKNDKRPPSSSRSVSSPHLKGRTSSLLKSRLQQNSTNSASPKKTARKASTQAMSPAKRVHPSRKASTTNDYSPLVARLTRSTTASDLKSNLKPKIQVPNGVKSLPTRQNIPLNLNIPKRSASEQPQQTIINNITVRTTRSSRLKHDASMNNLQSKLNTSTPTIKESQEKLTIPKRRTNNMTKSFSVNVGLKDLSNTANTTVSNTPSPSYTKRKPSRPRNLSSTVIPRARTPSSYTLSTKKIKTSQELSKTLLEFPKTRKLVQDWYEEMNHNTNKEEDRQGRDCAEVLGSEPLNSFEKAEVTKNNQVYYLGNTGIKIDSLNYAFNFGFDDTSKNLIVKPNDHINYRYQVLSKLGTGMFGKVYKCQDHKTNHIVSIKIMKNDINWSFQSINEIRILKTLHDDEYLLSYIEHFNFRSHICVATELLSVNLLEALESTKFEGFHLDVIKDWSRQLLSGLANLHSHSIIHADLKPENIMLKSPNSFDLKIIDFGSSSKTDELTFPYIQSRFYRAPEVLLGCRYDTKIDIWSFAVLIYEMYTGKPLFEAKDESELYKLIVKLMGHPPAKTVLQLRNEVFEKGSINKNNDAAFIDKKTMIFTKFDRLGSYKGVALETPRRDHPFYKRINLTNVAFANFLQSALIWNYHERPNASLLLEHNFLD